MKKKTLTYGLGLDEDHRFVLLVAAFQTSQQAKLDLSAIHVHITMPNLCHFSVLVIGHIAPASLGPSRQVVKFKRGG